jgi:Lsr2
MADKMLRLDDLHAAEGREVPADQRYVLTLQGKTYQLDLEQTNALAFEEVLGKYLNAATEVQAEAPALNHTNGVKRSPSTSKVPGRKFSKETVLAIREWAADQGFVVKDKGALPREVKEKWASAHNVDLNSLG